MKFMVKIFLFLFILLPSFLYSNEYNVNKKGFFIASGDPVLVSQKGFQITPPQGWEVSLTYPGTSLLMQAPYQKGIYQKTVQVLRFKGPQYIDEITLKEFAAEILRKFSKHHLDIKTSL